MNLLLQRLRAHNACPPSPVLAPPEPPPPPRRPAVSATFDLGRTVMTCGIEPLVTAGQLNPAYILARHQRGDWGDLSDGDKAANDRAVRDGGRILSAYVLPCGKVYVITDAEDDDGVRQVTTILLPEEY